MKIEKQNMEQTILKAAEELFIDQGFVKTSGALKTKCPKGNGGKG